MIYFLCLIRFFVGGWNNLSKFKFESRSRSIVQKFINQTFYRIRVQYSTVQYNDTHDISLSVKSQWFLEWLKSCLNKGIEFPLSLRASNPSQKSGKCNRILFDGPNYNWPVVGLFYSMQVWMHWPETECAQETCLLKHPNVKNKNAGSRS